MGTCLASAGAATSIVDNQTIEAASLVRAMTCSRWEGTKLDGNAHANRRVCCMRRSPLAGDALALMRDIKTKASPASGFLPVRGGGRLFLIRAVAAQALVALGEQVGQRHRFQLVELVQQHGLQADRHRARVSVGAAE